MKARVKIGLRWLLALVMITVGVTHFVDPGPFVRIVPASLPAPLLLVYISGLAEIAGGIGLAIPRLRSAAGWGLVVLYVAIFPANVNMAIHRIQPEDMTLSDAVLWGRLPIQALLIWIAWWVSRRDQPTSID